MNCFQLERRLVKTMMNVLNINFSITLTCLSSNLLIYKLVMNKLQILLNGLAHMTEIPSMINLKTKFTERSLIVKVTYNSCLALTKTRELGVDNTRMCPLDFMSDITLVLILCGNPLKLTTMSKEEFLEIILKL